MCNKKCLFCGGELDFIQLSRNRTFCSTSCSAKYRHKDRPDYIERVCKICNKPFLIENKKRLSTRKTCSHECSCKLKGFYTKGVLKKPIEDRKGPKIFKRKCVVCDSDFETISRTVLTCSKSCKKDLMSIKRIEHKADFNKRFIDTYEKAESVYDICNSLNIGYSTYYRMIKLLSIDSKFSKKGHRLREDGYFDYTDNRNHRKVYESHFGIKLSNKEQIHHIDGIKDNNSIDNLYLCKSASEHTKIHKSLEHIAFELFRMGLISFDKELGIYKTV